MNEIQMPERADPPAPAPAPPPRRGRSDGSLVLGVALAWVINVVGLFALLAFATLRQTFLPGHPSLRVGLNGLPLLVSVLTGAWMIFMGPRRTGIGIFIGIATIIAMIVLLVAACFGIASNLWR